MKKQTKQKLVVGREVVKSLTELRVPKLDEVRGGMMATCRGCGGCTEADSGCGIVTQ